MLHVVNIMICYSEWRIQSLSVNYYIACQQANNASLMAILS